MTIREKSAPVVRGLLAAGVAAALLVMLGGLWHLPARAAERSMRVPAPALDAPPLDGRATGEPGAQTAVLAGGCFWGVQGVFEHVKGVEQVLAGYSGGRQRDASYQIVSSGGTGHAEAVQIRFDPAVISYGRLLQVFFSVALDPTERDRQGPDTGTQYRSEVFATTPAQQRVAQDYIAQLGAARVYDRPIATRVDAMSGFYPAEAYHQDYLLHHPDNLYIVVNDLPKVAALKRLFPEIYREIPVTVAPPRPAS